MPISKTPSHGQSSGLTKLFGKLSEREAQRELDYRKLVVRLANDDAVGTETIMAIMEAAGRSAEMLDEDVARMARRLKAAKDLEEAEGMADAVHEAGQRRVQLFENYELRRQELEQQLEDLRAQYIDDKAAAESVENRQSILRSMARSTLQETASREINALPNELELKRPSLLNERNLYGHPSRDPGELPEDRRRNAVESVDRELAELDAEIKRAKNAHLDPVEGMKWSTPQ
ncbi:hypothetical protein [Planctomycetes bacterium Pan216]